MTVADRFSEYDDVRDHTVTLKRPEMRADATVSSLHFVGNANSTGGSHNVVDLVEITRRKNDLTRNARHRLGDEAAKSFAVFDNVDNVLRILAGAGKRNFVHP